MNKTLELDQMSVSQLEAYADQLIDKKAALDELLSQVDIYINTKKKEVQQWKSMNGAYLLNDQTFLLMK